MVALNISKRYILMRIIRFVLSFFIILTIIFILPRIAPGDPIENILGMDYISATPEQIEFLEQQYGLDKGLFEQYLIFLKSVFTLDLGYSISNNTSVYFLVTESIKVTVKVVLPALFIGATLAVCAGLYGGTHKGKPLERSLTTGSIVFDTIPNYILGILALSIFAFHLHLFPLGHMSSGSGDIFDTIHSLILPELLLTTSVFVGYYISIRNIVLQINEEYFITAERAHGMSEDCINSNHIFRNIMTQFVSMFALSLGGVISGALIIEIVFSLPGMGSVLFSAISFGDYPVIQGCFIFITGSVLLANMFAEIAYGFLDPRVSDGGRR